MAKIHMHQYAGEYARMYEDAGHEMVERLEDADVVQFIGGADVNPALYGHEAHPETYYDPMTDEVDASAFYHAQGLGIMCVGICRGGQFLNVMNGGLMYQDVDNHAIGGTHLAFDEVTERTVRVTSTHHQMMLPNPNGTLVATAELATRREVCYGEGVEDWYDIAKPDVECVWYGRSKSLCFQPHPEHAGADDCRAYFFDLLQRYGGLTL